MPYLGAEPEPDPPDNRISLRKRLGLRNKWTILDVMIDPDTYQVVEVVVGNFDQDLPKLDKLNVEFCFTHTPQE